MFSRFLNVPLALVCLTASAQPVLRVCADPDNLPFSNLRGEGFENRLAQSIAGNLGSQLKYVWWPGRRGAIRKTLGAGQCDVMLGVPAGSAGALLTRPYYRSSYVFVSRADRQLNLTSLNDERLAGWKIGVHVVGDDYAPPAHVLARRGMGGNLTGYPLFRTTGEHSAPGQLIEAVAKGDLDAAIAWGPFAGYFAKSSSVPMVVTPVSPAAFLGVPFQYDIAIAVREEDTALKLRLDRVLAAECASIQTLLAEYSVPTEGGPPCSEPASSRASSR
jgi:quinoprotein dehydrogenase-associated probable ABC transporter substrate-binding protein